MEDTTVTASIFSDGVHGGGFDPAKLAYQEVQVGDATLGVTVSGEYSFWVRDATMEGHLPAHFFVILPGPQRGDGSRSVLGCTCQFTGGRRSRGRDAQGEIVVPEAVGEVCLHAEAALRVALSTDDPERIAQHLRELGIYEMIIRAFLARQPNPGPA